MKKKSHQPLYKTISTSGTDAQEVLSTSQLASFVENWLDDCDLKEHSPRTIEMRRGLLLRLLRFLWDAKHAHCGREELREFFAGLKNLHTGERMRPSTAETYHRVFCAFFNWCVQEEILSVSPMLRVPKPRVPRDQVTPLTEAQQRALLRAAKQSYCGLRNYALVRFLLDTGVRATELCVLNVEDLDLDNRKARILGKGNKYRTVFFGKHTWKALRLYLQTKKLYPEKPVFVAESGDNTQERLTRSGVYQIVSELGKEAGIKAVRCSPHSLRHSAAINFLRGGGQVFELKLMLGHEALSQTLRYCKVVEGDLEKRFRRRSALDDIE